MLGRAHRMRDGQDFRVTVRRGRKSAQPLLVAHVHPGQDGTTSVGLIVSKAVGPAVTRNRVKRRLRHVMRDRLDAVPVGSRVVLRALPASSAASSEQIAAQVEVALARAVPR